MSSTVGEVARLAGVSVRTLHHYDDIGLLSPTARTAAGYRQYDDADIARLQRILCYRELGFGLDEISSVLANDTVDTLQHLRDQHRMLTERIARLQRIAARLEDVMEARKMGINLDPHEMLEVFGDSNPAEHADEAAARWGDTDAFRESHRRSASYGKHDWLRMRREQDDIERRFVEALGAGVPPDSVDAMQIAEAHREHISTWFYGCPPQMHRALGEMYVADERFTAHYDAVAPGLARYVRDAVVANAQRHGAGSGG